MLEALTCAIDAFGPADMSRLGDGETLEELHRQLERLHAVVARAAAAFEAGRHWEADGARSAAAWISSRCRQPLPVARRRVRLGRALRAMPATEAAWWDGAIGEAQVDLLAGARKGVGGAMFDPDEAFLVSEAKDLHHRDFVRVMAYWLQAADPDGVEQDAHAERDSRRFHLSESLDGMWFLDGVLDPMSGEAVSRVLGAIERELFEADWAEAKQTKGEHVRADDLSRTSAQRRADALLEMARRAAAMPAGARLPAPLLTILVGYETFAGRICQVASGTVVAPGAVLPWLTEAYVERVVFDGPDRVKNVGVRRRLFTGATRRAVEVRDRECFSEFCQAPAEDCEIDHVHPYGDGGLTTDDNGRPACDYHNRRRNRSP